VDTIFVIIVTVMKIFAEIECTHCAAHFRIEYGSELIPPNHNTEGVIIQSDDSSKSCPGSGKMAKVITFAREQ
jgi:hypothetical protein